jgi:long-chain acyl-CoA synthetase
MDSSWALALYRTLLRSTVPSWPFETHLVAFCTLFHTCTHLLESRACPWCDVQKIPDAFWWRHLPSLHCSFPDRPRAPEAVLDASASPRTPSQSLNAMETPTIQYSHEVPGTATATRGAARMSPIPSLYDPKWTLYTNLMETRRALDPEGTGPLFGSRPRDPQTGEVVDGEYEWVTLGEFVADVEACASGMKSKLQLPRGAIVGVFSKNRYEWVLVEHATSRMAYTLVPLYDTLGPTAIPFIMSHTDMSVVFCAKEQFKTLMGCIDQCPTVKTVVQFEDDVDNEEVELAKQHKVQLLRLSELTAFGKEHVAPADPPLPSDVCTICYTSGTTGDPKGVMLTHANLMAAVGCSLNYVCINKDDVHLSYLPLAHCFERVIQTAVIYVGARVGFFQGNVAKMLEDLAVLKPTIFPGVPRVLNRIHDKITQGVAHAGGVKKWLFDTAYASKRSYLEADSSARSHMLWDWLVFNRAKEALGGRVRRMMNGSAPLSVDVKQFVQVVFGVPMLEGYGLTETAAVTACSTDDIPSGDHIGIPLADVQICLEDVPDMNYTSRDEPRPRGEILIKCPNLFVGYYKEPEKTKEVMDADGWFHSGDIGCWNPDGTLSIIDRKKNIFKLQQGEYVAPEKIEGIYIKSPLVAQAYVHGDSLQSFLVAIIVPDADIVRKWAAENGVEATLEELCDVKTHPELAQAIAKDLEELGTRYKLFGFERVRKLRLHAEQFTAENDLATPTFKLKRPAVAKRFRAEIDEMYSE